MRRWLFLIALTTIPVSLWAQTPEDRARAAESITAQTLAQHVGVIADDSMKGRATPSHGLDMTAQYVIDQFKRLGLTPGGEDSTWFQHYTIPANIDFARSQLVFATDSATATAKLSTTARLIKPTTQQGVLCTPVLVAGRQRAELLVRARLSNRCVLYVPPSTPDAASQQALEFLQRTCLGLVILGTSDSADFARGVQAAQQRSYLDWREDWGVEVRPEAVTGLRDVLTTVGVALPQVRADTTPLLRELPELRISLDLQFDQTGGATAPNVIGILKGRDTSLQNEYVVYQAHMDHAAVVRGQPDRTGNGANDNASGVAGLIELAKAFSQPGARPARSLAFVATSGNANNFRGSEAFADRVMAKTFRLGFKNIFKQCGSNIYVERVRTGGVRISCQLDESALKETMVSSAVAAINLDQIGRAAGDSVVINGMDDAEFESSSPMWMTTAHPELHLTVVDGGTAIAPESDQYSLARRGVPSLYFHDQLGHGAVGTDTTDSPHTLNLEQAARIVRLAFYIGFGVADAKRGPQWTLEGRQGFLEHNPDQ